MAIFSSSAIPAGSTGFDIDNSLRFNDDDSAYLSKTLSTPTNANKYTLSMWVKLGNIENMFLFGAGANTSNNTYMRLYSGANQAILWETDVSASDQWYVRTNALLRDPSAWYHLMFVMDSSQSGISNQAKIYINGELASTASGGTRSTDYTNTATAHYIGRSVTADYFDGYMSEVHFVDGQALGPSDFGESDATYGHWKPKEVTLTPSQYGNNGFYLPMNQDYTVEGFSATTYTGTGANQYIGGTGFSPDLLWLKARSASGYDNILQDSLRGSTYQLYSNATASEVNDTDAVTSFDADGFSLGGDITANNNNVTYVAWSWDMGGTLLGTGDFTQGTIPSTCKASTTYGQSIVSYTGQSPTTGTIGHGLSSPPELIITKNRDTTGYGWLVGATVLNSSWTGNLALNITDPTWAETPTWNGTAPTDEVFSIGADTYGNKSGDKYIAYCFHSVTGYSSIGKYTGTGSNQTITTGFKPAFVMWKALASENWVIIDNVRGNGFLRPDEDVGEGTQSNIGIDFIDTGFIITGTDTKQNGSSFGDYIYMAFADKREYAYWLDDSGNNNDWTAHNLTESDVSKDSPTNNFATLNPLEEDSAATTLSEGSLKVTIPSATATGKAFSTIAQSSGKWYWEVYYISRTASGDYLTLGLQTTDESALWNIRGSDGERWDNGSGSAGTLTRYTTGDVIGIAVDLDNGKWYISTNNTWQNAGNGIGNPTAGTGQVHSGLSGEFQFVAGNASSSGNNIFVVNFGQDSSFAGNKTPNGETDSKDIGDFFYTPPTDFLALCTKNLPEPTVVPSENFNTVAWPGTSNATLAITDVGFKPDFVWIKSRSTAYGHNHALFDSVRGISKGLVSNSTNIEYTVSGVTSFDPYGFTLGSDNAAGNENGFTYVAWNWKAGNATLGTGDFTQGTIPSTCSRNVDAGFSIVSWTGDNSGNATVGHGLDYAPEMIIVKCRDEASRHWLIWHEAYNDNDKAMLFNTDVPSDTRFGPGAPTTDLFGLQNDQGNRDGKKFIAYCFHSVDGYSKFGKYTANNSTDGTFVHCSFRPAYVMVKAISSSGNWYTWDSERGQYNVIGERLALDSHLGEGTTPLAIDFVSNGFKFRDTNGGWNYGSREYIYMAFAETPFKYSNAR